RQLRALSRAKLYGMHLRSHRNRAQLHGIARLDRSLVPAEDLLPCTHVAGRQDVATFAIDVLDQGNMRAPVRIVFDPFDRAANAVLVAPEVNAAIVVLVTTAAALCRCPAGIVAPTGVVLRLQQRRMRRTLPQMQMAQLRAASTARRCRLCFED